MADDVVSTAKLVGADQVVSDFEKIGAAGAAAAAQVDSGFKGSNAGLSKFEAQVENVRAASEKFGASIRNVGTAFGQMTSNIGRSITTAARYATIIGGMVAIANRLSQSQDEQTIATKEATKEYQQASKSLENLQLRELQNAKAVDDLSVAFARGEISAADYAKQLVKLRQDQARAEEFAKKEEAIKQIAERDRIQADKIKQQAAAQREFAATVRVWGSDTASALQQFGTAWDSFLAKWNAGPSVIATAVRTVSQVLTERGGEIIAIFDRIGTAFTKLFDVKPDANFGDTVIAALGTIEKTITGIVIPVFQKLLTAARAVATFINSMFGTDISGEMILIALAVAKITGALGFLAAAVEVASAAFGVLKAAMIALWSVNPITAVIVAIGLLAAALIALNWDSVVAAVKQMWDGIVNIWNGGVAILQQIIRGIGVIWDAVWAGLSSAAKVAMDAVVAAIEWAMQPINRFIELVNRAWEALKRLVGLQQKSEAAGGAGGFKRGGMIRGGGTSTSDSVPIWASAGEWMMRARAVQYYGRGFMNAINSLSFPRDGLDSLADALVVSTPRARYAAGGEITRNSGSDGRPVILQFPDGQKFVLNAASETADRLGHYAVSRRLASSGRKPSYYGGGY